jgi:hypothetical protein
LAASLRRQRRDERVREPCIRRRRTLEHCCRSFCFSLCPAHRGSGRSAGTSVFTSGRLWITPHDGRLVRTELISRLDRQARALGTITVEYGNDNRLAAWVPLLMSEEYFVGTVRVWCVAEYTNYRRFETEAKLLPKS